MTIGATLIASFLATLERPSTWPLALAGFLVRGGVVLVVAPIVVLPSVVGLANVVVPGLTDLVFGGMTVGVLVFLAALVLGGLGWVLVGGWFAATLEHALIEIVAGTEAPAVTLRPDSGLRSRRAIAPRILAARLVASLPLVLALAWAASRLAETGYREFTRPTDVVTPVAARIVLGAPEAVGLVTLTWLLGEIVGAMAARAIVLADEDVVGGLVTAVRRLVRHPIRILSLALIPLAALALVLGSGMAAASVAWEAARTMLTGGDEGVAAIGIVVLFIALWCGGLVLGAILCAWRAAAWTVDGGMTFGVASSRRERDWPWRSRSGRLGSPRPRGADPDSR